MCKKLLAKLFANRKGMAISTSQTKEEVCPIAVETLQKTLSSLTKNDFIPCSETGLFNKSQWQYLHQYEVVEYNESYKCARLTEKGYYIYKELQKNSSRTPESLHKLISEKF